MYAYYVSETIVGTEHLVKKKKSKNPRPYLNGLHCEKGDKY